MYERLLVPLDGSELAEVAIPYAEELAGRLDSEVVLLHICKSVEDQSWHMHQLYLNKLVEVVEREAKEFADKAGRGSEYKGKVKAVIAPGEPAGEIIDYARKNDVDMIIMATHGRSGLGRWALGSVADKVIRGTGKPVILIRAKGPRPAVQEKRILTKALVTLDGSPVGEAALPYVEELAARLGMEVILLQVLSPVPHVYAPEVYDYGVYSELQMESMSAFAKNYLKKVENRLKSKGICCKCEIVLGSAAEEIISLADKIRADIVAMSTHGRSGILRWVFGSVADKILYGGNTPLLLVRAPGAQPKR